MGSGEGVVAVSAYMDGTRGSGVLSSAGDVLEMSVVRGVGGVCDTKKLFLVLIKPLIVLIHFPLDN